MYGCVFFIAHVWRTKDKFWESVPLSCEFLESNLGLQAWVCSPFPSEPFCNPQLPFKKYGHWCFSLPFLGQSGCNFYGVWGLQSCSFFTLGFTFSLCGAFHHGGWYFKLFFTENYPNFHLHLFYFSYLSPTYLPKVRNIFIISWSRDYQSSLFINVTIIKMTSDN